MIAIELIRANYVIQQLGSVINWNALRLIYKLVYMVEHQECTANQ